MVCIGPNITVTVISVAGQQVKLGFAAPSDIRVDREEIRARVDAGIPHLNDTNQAENSRRELERYRTALYRANGYLLQMGREPVKLEYLQSDAGASGPVDAIDTSGKRVDKTGFSSDRCVHTIASNSGGADGA
jgi:carbon storage regulator CsrA